MLGKGAFYLSRKIRPCVWTQLSEVIMSKKNKKNIKTLNKNSKKGSKAHFKSGLEKPLEKGAFRYIILTNPNPFPIWSKTPKNSLKDRTSPDFFFATSNEMTSFITKTHIARCTYEDKNIADVLVYGMSILRPTHNYIVSFKVFKRISYYVSMRGLIIKC